MSNIYDALSKGKGEAAPGTPRPSAPPTPVASRTLPPAAGTGSAASLERLRQRLVLELGVQKPPVILFTGSVPGEGTSTLALRFARELAESDSRAVLLVDGDLTGAGTSLSSVLSAGGDHAGLTELLEGGSEADQAVLGTERSNLHFLPVGRRTAAPLELIRPERAGALFRELTRRYAFVVVDAGATLFAPETALLGASADGVVIVVRANRTRREVVQKAVAALGAAGCRLLGVVLNDRRYPIPGFLYRRI